MRTQTRTKVAIQSKRRKMEDLLWEFRPYVTVWAGSQNVVMGMQRLPFFGAIQLVMRRENDGDKKPVSLKLCPRCGCWKAGSQG